MNQTRIALQDWIEAGAQLPAQPDLIELIPLVVFQAMEASPPARPEAKPAQPDCTEAVTLILFQALQAPLQQVQILEQRGRVCLVQFAPYGLDDPVMPVALVNFGETYNRHFCEVAYHLAEWNEYGLTQYQRDWSQYALSRAAKMLSIVERSGKLSWAEWNYYRRQLMLALARPDR